MLSFKIGHLLRIFLSFLLGGWGSMLEPDVLTPRSTLGFWLRLGLRLRRCSLMVSSSFPACLMVLGAALRQDGRGHATSRLQEEKGKEQGLMSPAGGAAIKATETPRAGQVGLPGSGEQPQGPFKAGLPYPRAPANRPASSHTRPRPRSSNGTVCVFTRRQAC